MTLFTLRCDRKASSLPLYVYIGVTIFVIIFSLIYEYNSHNVYSTYMAHAFVWPFSLGVVVYLLFNLIFHKYGLPLLSSYFYNCGVATLTVGSIFKGILTIYGTTREVYEILFYVLGFILLGVGVLLYVLGLILFLKQEKTKKES